MTWATRYFTTHTANVYSAEYTPLQSIKAAISDGGMDCINAADLLLGAHRAVTKQGRMEVDKLAR